MAQIFISYARDGSYGESLAEETQKQLQAFGFSIFRDVIGLKAGDVWYSKLEFEIEACDVMVLIVSEKIRTSEWVHNEVSMAKEIGKPVIPVLAESIRMPLWLRHLQVLDFSNEQNWTDLSDSINPYLALEQTKTTASPAKIITNISPKVDSVPSWSSYAGEDQYGRYADLDVKGVVQRCRWIEAGTFWMGSPQDEVARNSNEIRHQVTLTKGFWMADTACSQALWEVIMGSNPSYFKATNNPVETVSWDDTQRFLQVLNQQVSGLTARLPTEAEWEYSCRVGTTTPFSFGTNITPEQVNYNGNYPYNGATKGQYREKTIELKSLPINHWGLYEMHGNVWEWCQDGFDDYPAEQVNDPVSEGKKSRVLRGGSWFNYGRNVRSASRDGYSPVRRYDYLGFRFSLGH